MNRITATTQDVTLTRTTGTCATSGDNEIIASPGAGMKIVICAYHIQNETSNATTAIFKDGSTAFRRVRMSGDGDGIDRELEPEQFVHLSANSAFNINLSGANSCGYSIVSYTTVA
jgi:hypothetical protein